MYYLENVVNDLNLRLLETVQAVWPLNYTFWWYVRSKFYKFSKKVFFFSKYGIALGIGFRENILIWLLKCKVVVLLDFLFLTHRNAEEGY